MNINLLRQSDIAWYLSLAGRSVVECGRVADERGAVDDDGDVVDKQTVRVFLVWRQLDYVQTYASQRLHEFLVLMARLVDVDRLSFLQVEGRRRRKRVRDARHQRKVVPKTITTIRRHLRTFRRTMWAWLQRAPAALAINK